MSNGKTFAANSSTENMCDSCEWSIAECCQTEPTYGNGVGEDNVIECDQYSGIECLESL